MRPWFWRVLLACALAVPFLWRLDAEEYHGDESHWISSGQHAFYLLTSGQARSADWKEQFYLSSQPQIGKLLIGAALAIAGTRGPVEIYDYDWQLRLEENRAAGRVPPERDILAARVPGAIAGWVGCLLLWAIATALGQPAAGAAAAVLLASHPLWLANARRAGLDTTALTLGLLSTWAVVKALNELNALRLYRRRSIPAPNGAGKRAAGEHPAPEHDAGELSGRRARATTILWWLAAGATLGAAAGAKYVALLTAPPAAALTIAAARQRDLRRFIVPAGAVAAATAALVFFVTNPALFDAPLDRLRSSVEFFAVQAGHMRRMQPLFSSPLLVAAEIFDRVVWPTAYPPIVDITLPEPLRPGSYGAPVVAAGTGVFLVLFVGGTVRGAALAWAAAIWLVVVYLLLALSIPIWWERWHLPLVPPLCLTAGIGYAAARDAAGRRGGRPSLASWAPAAAQYVAALAILPSYLGNGFGALLLTPAGAAAHLAGFVIYLAALVSHARRHWAGDPTRALSTTRSSAWNSGTAPIGR
jgi:4-amino-4-deoxy-L-arabinose transferase-like glycosyltransferase